MTRWNDKDLERFKDRISVKDYTSLPANRSIVVTANGKQETVKVRKAMTHEESELQQNCVKAFRLHYPKYKMRLFSIPNEAIRSAANASRMLAQGLLPGAFDTILAIPKGKYGGAFIEFKYGTARLSDYQMQFLREMEKHYYCTVARSVEEFLKEIKYYLALK